MKHKLKNIAVYPIQIDGTDITAHPEQIVEAEITSRNRYLIQNKFLEDLGIILEKKKAKEEEEKKDIEPDFLEEKSEMPKKKGRKSKKNKSEDE